MSSISGAVISNIARSRSTVYESSTDIHVKLRGGYVGDGLGKTHLKRLLVRASTANKLLIIDHSNEIHLWWNGTLTESVFEVLHTCAEATNTNPNIIVFQTSNLGAVKAYNDWATAYSVTACITVEPLLTYIADVCSWLGTEYDVNTYVDTPKPAVFTCWLGRKRSHKLDVAKWLYANGYLTDRCGAARVSLISDYAELYSHVDTVDPELHSILNRYRSIEGTETIPRWNPGPEYFQAHQDTYFDFVVEPITEEVCDNYSQIAAAHPWNQTVCAVERVCRAILLRRPFIILGNRHTLKLLHSLGFKTFPTLFDESYDSLEYSDRFAHITDQINSLVRDPLLHAKVYNSTIADAVNSNYENLKRYGPEPVKYLDALSHY